MAWIARLIQWAKGYNINHLRVGLQVFIAYLVVSAIVFPAKVWNSLDYGALTPSFALVFLALMSPNNVGGTTLKAIFTVSGYLLGGLAQATATYAAWGINGGSFENTVTKIAVFTTYISILAGIFNICRWHWAVTNILFLLASVGLVVAGGVATFPLPYLAWKAPFYVTALMVIAAATMTLIAWFAFPITAGAQYRQHMCSAFRSIGDAVDAVRPLIFAPLDPATGLPREASGVLNNKDGIDTGLAEKVNDVGKHLKSARHQLTASRSLQLPVRFEFDIWCRPCIFPATAFVRSKLTAWYSMSCSAILVRPLQSGHLRLTAVQNESVKCLFDAVFCGIADLLRTLGDVVTDKATYKQADHALDLLDDAWTHLLDAVANLVAERECSEDEAFALHVMTALTYVVGTRARAAFAALPEAIYARDKTAPAIRAAHLARSPGWVRPSDAFRDPFRSARMLLSKFRPTSVGPIASIDNGAGRSDARRFPRFFQGVRSKEKTTSGLVGFGRQMPSSPTRALDRLYNVPVWLIFGVQYGVAMAIAVLLTGIPAVRTTVLHNRTVDLAVTVAATWMPTVGDMHWRAFNRVLGTAAGAVWSYFLLAMSYAVNGASWENSAGKFITAAFLTAVWASLCAMHEFKYPRYAVLWLVAGITVPLAAIPSIRAPEPPWATLGWRIVNVIIGSFILWVVSLTVFPVSVRHVVFGNLTAALDQLAALARQMPEQLASRADTSVGGGGDLEAGALQSPKSPRSPLNTVQSLQAFFSPANENPVILAIKVERTLTALTMQLPALRAEQFLFLRPRNTGASDIADATASAQHIAHMLMFTFAVRVDHSPQKPWRIAEIHQHYLKIVADCAADSLDALSRVINTHESMQLALDTLDRLDYAVQEHLDRIVAAIVTCPERGPAVADPHGDVLPLPLALITYVEIGLSQQLRLLYRAIARGFLSSDLEAIHLAEEKASSKSAIGPHIWPESVLALMLEADISRLEQSSLFEFEATGAEAAVSNGKAQFPRVSRSWGTFPEQKTGETEEEQKSGEQEEERESGAREEEHESSLPL